MCEPLGLLLRGWAGTYFGEYEDPGQSGFADASVPLDPIAKTIPRSLRSDRLLQTTVIRFTKDACLVVRDESIFRSLLKNGWIKISHRGVVARKWLRQLIELRSCGVLTDGTKGQVIYSSTYFAVLKGAPVDGAPQTCRSIFNGKRLNQFFVDPSPVNLLGVDELLKMMAEIPDSSGMSMYTADIRHFFHTIGVQHELGKNVFGLRCADAFFRWQCVPMGWSHSPSVAQRLAYGIVLHRERNGATEDSLGARFDEEAAHPPRFVPIYDGDGPNAERIGFLTVLYDNILIAARDHAVVKRWQARVERNMKLFGLELKYSRSFNAGELAGRKRARSDDVEKGVPTHVGIEFGLCRIGGRWRARWRHPIEKWERWRGAFGRVLSGDELTPREVATAAGVLVWDCVLSMSSFDRIGEVLTILSRVGKLVGGRRRAWSERMVTLTVEERACFERFGSEVNLNEWRMGPEEPSSRRRFFATDASDALLGGVEFNTVGNILQESWWQGRGTSGHIFLREVEACIEFVTRQLRDEESPLNVFVAVDNTAAVHALRRGWSTNRKAAEMLGTFHAFLRKKSAKLFVVPVRGTDNVADWPTRPETAFSQTRADETFAGGESPRLAIT